MTKFLLSMIAQAKGAHAIITEIKTLNLNTISGRGGKKFVI